MNKNKNTILRVAIIGSLLLAGSGFAKAPAIYSQKCAPCHGLYGGGDGTLGDILELKKLKIAGASDLTGKLKAINASNKLKLVRKVSHFTKKLTASEMKGILAFIRKFKKPGKVPLTNNLYKVACINCHGVNGDGKPTFQGLAGKAKNFRSSSLQKLKYSKLKALVQNSAKKKIRLRSPVKHFSRKLSAAEIKAIASYLGGN